MKNLERLEYLFGNTNIEKLKQAKVAVIGLGGVGGVAALALARCGVGSLIIQDYDIVQESNINRQLIANYETLGRKKADVMEEIKTVYDDDIFPNLDVEIVVDGEMTRVKP
jgi:tRNA A37 threonylcarbamoyladenosine dehydratase